MPKKTREEKIIASYRKKLKLLQQQTYTSPLPETIRHKPVAQEITPVSPAKNIINEDSSLKKFFVQDFRKSILLIFFILSLEIIFYFARIK